MTHEETMYIIMEANYLKENNRTIEEDNSDLFPKDWYSYDDLVLKTEIMMEAINKKIIIKETELYKSKLLNRCIQD